MLHKLYKTKLAKMLGHVEQRAQQRSTITDKEIKALRKSLLKMRLRKGMTYHYTWPGRGHAIIGDVGKKMPRHVVKTIYKPSDNPPGRRITKLAGGGARALKSFSRVIERMATPLAKEHNRPFKDVYKELFTRSAQSGLHHTIPSGVKPSTATNTSAARSGGNVRHLTTGGLWPKRSYLPDGSPEPVVQTIPFKDIRKMRGKFGVDIMAAEYPLGQTGNAMTYSGKIPTKSIITRPYNQAAKKAGSLPKNLQYPGWTPDGYPNYSNPLGFPRGDAQLQAPYLQTPKQQFLRHPLPYAERDTIRAASGQFDVAWGDGAWGKGPRNLYKPPPLPTPMSQWTPAQRAARLTQLKSIRDLRRKTL